MHQRGFSLIELLMGTDNCRDCSALGQSGVCGTVRIDLSRGDSEVTCQRNA